MTILVKYINPFLYFVFYIGLLLVFGNSFAQSIENRKAKALIKKGLEQEESIKSKFAFVNKCNDYVTTMMMTMKGRAFKKEDVTEFYFTSVGLAVIGFIVSGIFMAPKVAPLVALTLGSVPFVNIRSKLEQNRNQTSKEGELLITELLNNYKIYGENMREAIEITAETLSSDAPHSKTMLSLLAYSLLSAQNHEQEREAIENFRFGINTNWASTLAINIEFAIVEGRKVTNAMEDLVSSIIKARKIMEETERQGAEGVKMLKYMVPMIYILTVIAAVFFFDLTPAQFLHNQFQTDIGSTLFVVIILSYLATIMVSRYFSHGKMDL